MLMYGGRSSVLVYRQNRIAMRGRSFSCACQLISPSAGKPEKSWTVPYLSPGRQDETTHNLLKLFLSSQTCGLKRLIMAAFSLNYRARGPLRKVIPYGEGQLSFPLTLQHFFGLPFPFVSEPHSVECSIVILGDFVKFLFRMNVPSLLLMTNTSEQRRHIPIKIIFHVQSSGNGKDIRSDEIAICT